MITVAGTWETNRQVTNAVTDMLELGMDMEADLGIDSIKRVEILGTFQEHFPGMPEMNPEELAELRTLEEIVNYMKDFVGAESSAGAPAPAVNTAATTMSAAVPATKRAQAVMTPMGQRLRAGFMWYLSGRCRRGGR